MFVEEKYFVLFPADELVDELDIKDLMRAIRQPLKREKVLEDEATSLEQIVEETFLFAGWLGGAEARGIPEARVQPAADEELGEHVDLVAHHRQLWLLRTSTVNPALQNMSCLCRCIRRFDDQNLHHCSERVRHRLGHFNETVKDFSDHLKADVRHDFRRFATITLCASDI